MEVVTLIYREKKTAELSPCHIAVVSSPFVALSLARKTKELFAQGTRLVMSHYATLLIVYTMPGLQHLAHRREKSAA